MKPFIKTKIPILRTDRLELQPQTIDHVEGLFKPFQDKSLYQYIKRGPLKNIKQLYNGIKSLHNRMSPDKTEHCLNWVLITPSNHEYIGQVEVSMPVGERYFYLAYTIFKRYWRQGFAKESCICIINYMFKEWKTDKVIMEMDTRNIASVKLAENLDAKRVAFRPKAQMLKGEWSDGYVYELTRK